MANTVIGVPINTIPEDVSANAGGYFIMSVPNLGLRRIMWSNALPKNIASYDPLKTNYVMMKDGTDRPAGDLGKNVANSALTSVANAGLTLGANWALDTAGYYYYVKGLPDKSQDVLFDSLLVQNRVGQMATSNGAPLFGKMARLLPDKGADGSYNKILVSNANGDTGLGDATNLVTALQGATQAEINTIFNMLGGNYLGMTSPAVNAISPPAVPYVDNSTQEITLYGAGLNILNDPLTASVKIIDVTTGNAYTVGYNSVNGNQLKIYVPWNIISVGKSYKVQITNGVMNYQTVLSFEVVDGNRFQQIQMQDAQWSFTELQSGAVAKNGKPALMNGVFTAPQATSTSVNTGVIEGVFYYDLSSLISNQDNFFIEFSIGNASRYYGNTDSLYVGFSETSAVAAAYNVGEGYKGNFLKYGSGVETSNWKSIFTINPVASLSVDGTNIITDFTVMRKNGIVTTTIISNNTGKTIAVTLNPSQAIQNLKLAFMYSLRNFDSQVKIKKLIKW